MSLRHVIVLCSDKGGCGKTTLAVNLAAAFATQSKVLLLDLDGRNLTASEFFEPNPHDMETVFGGKLSIEQAAQQVRPRLSVLSGTRALTKTENTHHWSKLPHLVREVKNFDVVIFDTPASWDTPAGLAAIDSARRAGRDNWALIPINGASSTLSSGLRTFGEVQEFANRPLAPLVEPGPTEMQRALPSRALPPRVQSPRALPPRSLPTSAQPSRALPPRSDTGRALPPRGLLARVKDLVLESAEPGVIAAEEAPPSLKVRYVRTIWRDNEVTESVELAAETETEPWMWLSNFIPATLRMDELINLGALVFDGEESRTSAVGVQRRAYLRLMRELDAKE